MKTVTGICAQGDMLIIPVKKIPKGLKKAEIVNGEYILAHSETGHHHVIDAPKADVFVTDDEFKAFMEVITPAEIKHKRSFDTHESLELPKGKYEIRRQREHTPEGFRKAQD